MAFETYLVGGGPIFLGVVIALTELLKWPRWIQYIWAALAIFWGVWAFI